MPNPDPTTRFSTRVADYIRYRPGYPDGLLDILQNEAGLSPASMVADIGSGTGISTELLLRSGATIHAVEPNPDMRHAAEQMLGDRPNFRSINGRAEATGLPDAGIDLITAAQAFHWFDREEARREFVRILRPNGWVALFWNTRRTDASEFLRGYEDLLREFATDYVQVDHRHVDTQAIADFFRGPFATRILANEQVFDFEGLKGRLLSSSYAPAAGHPKHLPMIDALRILHDRHADGGKVRFLYDVEVYFGRLEG
ncbi:MAG: class I SAM-dependent methyltransferase [Candidatus Zixiibacteriota bacterium]